MNEERKISFDSDWIQIKNTSITKIPYICIVIVNIHSHTINQVSNPIIFIGDSKVATFGNKKKLELKGNQIFFFARFNHRQSNHIVMIRCWQIVYHHMVRINE